MLQVLFRQHSTMKLAPRKRDRIEKQSSMTIALSLSLSLCPCFSLTWWSMLGSSWLGQHAADLKFLAHLLWAAHLSNFFFYSLKTKQTWRFDNNNSYSLHVKRFCGAAWLCMLFSRRCLFCVQSCWKALLHHHQNQFCSLSGCSVWWENTRQQWHFGCALDFFFGCRGTWMKATVDSEKEFSWSPTKRPNKLHLATLILSAAICIYSVIQMGMKALNGWIIGLKWLFHHLLFSCCSHSNGVQTWRARELGAAKKTSTVVIALR